MLLGSHGQVIMAFSVNAQLHSNIAYSYAKSRPTLSLMALIPSDWIRMLNISRDKTSYLVSNVISVKRKTLKERLGLIYENPNQFVNY